MRKLFLSFVLVLFCLVSNAQKRAYVVIHSSKKYISARLVGEQAAKVLNYPINLRQLKENAQLGLSLPHHLCTEANAAASFPYYPIRGAKHDGAYISVEYSSAYAGWSQGYYLVVIASGKVGDPTLRKSLKAARAYYADAYIKTL